MPYLDLIHAESLDYVTVQKSRVNYIPIERGMRVIHCNNKQVNSDLENYYKEMEEDYMLNQ